MENREQILERIIYECVGLSDIMRSGIPDGERIYNEINTKFESHPSIETPDEEGNRIAQETLYSHETELRRVVTFEFRDLDDGEEWDDDDDEPSSFCSCRYCHCSNYVRDDGEICHDCEYGAHQS
jgi:hypothetical protein